MKKIIISVFLSLFCTSIAFATTVTKVSFGSYTGAVTCNVWGMKRFASTSIPAQLFTPDPALSRKLVITDKSFKNYSTPPKSGIISVGFSCTNGVTSDPVLVKFYMNGIDTYFFTVDSGVFGINP